MRAGALLVIAFTLVAVPAPARVNPRLKDVHRIYVRTFTEPADPAVTLEPRSPEFVRHAVVDRIVSSGRFAAVKEEAKADAYLEGTAGYHHSEKDGKSFSTGYAHLQLVDVKSGEVLWLFDYKRQPAAGGRASDRVADQLIEKLLADAAVADDR